MNFFYLKVSQLDEVPDCRNCTDQVEGESHGAEFLTDFDSGQLETWWQSETLAENLQNLTSVNLTVHLGIYAHYIKH